MHKRLTSFLDRCNILYKHQYGFQSGKSKYHAILDLHTKGSWKQRKSCAIFLEIAKAFDMINNDIYLSGRYQSDKINNAKSDNKAIVCDVPQGSLLETSYFFSYIYNIYIYIYNIYIYI